MQISVTVKTPAQKNEVPFAVLTQMRAKLDVMELEIPQRATKLTSPVIAVENSDS